MWHKQGRKVLLFSQSTQMLDILESFVLDEEYSYLRMDGGTSVGSRQVLVNKFNQVQERRSVIHCLVSIFVLYEDTVDA